MPSPHTTLVLSAGEASGDALAAELATALLKRRPGLRLRGLAGPKMRAAGVEAIGRVEDLGVMGVAEVLGALSRVRAARAALRAALAEGPAMFVPVDAPDLHLPMIPDARRAGAKVVLYGVPQVWAWRRGRAKTLARDADELLCLLPFEPACFEPYGGRATFVGHPALDRAGALTPRGDDWAIFPGSREGELRRLLPVFLDVARGLRAARPGAVVRLALAPTVSAEKMRQLAQDLGRSLDDVVLVEGVLAAALPARACLAASGTVTLELACLGRPAVVAYKVHWLTYWIGRLLVRGVEHMALPNLILGERVFPEHLQQLDVDTILADLLRLAEPGQDRSAQRVRERLGPPGAADRAAERILSRLDGAN